MTTHIDIFIKTDGVVDPAHHRIEADITVAALKLHLSGGAEAIGILVFEENEDHPLPDHHEIRHCDGPVRHLHHTRCRHVHVIVRYAGRAIERDFGPGFTLMRVKEWAEDALGLAADDAAELSLQLAGKTERPDGSIHVGSLAGCPDCRVSFDLLPTTRVNG